MEGIPVILITYNRPWHTRQVLDSLREHNIQNLFIFSDGPKNNNDLPAISETRQLFQKIDWTIPVIIEREKNIGLAKSIISAVNYVFQTYDRMILLEDDCVPQKYFFTFMKDCLEKYENNHRVFGISGYTVPTPEEILCNYPYDLYFFPRIGSWGWATWKRAWQYFEPNLACAYKKSIDNNIDLSQGGDDIPIRLNEIASGKLWDVWTLNWVLSVYLNNGYYVYPTVSHINNIGTDGSGVHSDKTDQFVTRISDRKPSRYPDNVIVDEQIYRNFRKYYDQQPSHRTYAVPKTTRSLKVVHLCTEDFGGAGRAAYRLHKALQQAGVNSSMLVLNKKSNDPSVKVLPQDYTTDYNPVYMKQYEKWQKLLAQFPAKSPEFVFTDVVSDIKLDCVEEIHNADIVNLHWVAGLVDYANAPSAFGSKPVVWTLHDMNAFTGGCHYARDCVNYKTMCNRCPGLGSAACDDISLQVWKQKLDVYRKLNMNVVTPSRWLGNCAAESALLSRFPVHVIANGLNTQLFKPYPKAQIRRILNIPESAKVILFGACSVVNERKGFKYLLSAINGLSLKNVNDNVVLALFGTLPRNVKINSEFPVISLGSISREKYLAMVYSAADVFVIPSVEDNLPNTVLEAMACGVPVVGFNIGGIPDMIEHKKTGYLVRPKDVADLIEGIDWALRSYDRGIDLPGRCRQKVMNEFAGEVQAGSYIRLYNQISQDNSKPRCNQTTAVVSTQSAPLKVDVSIVIATKDRAKLLDQMLTSLKLAANGISYEVIVVEGSSSDNTLQVLQKHGVTKIYNESQHLGPGRHSWPQLYNFGFSKASGRWAMYASDDIVFNRSCLTKTIQTLQSQKSPSVAGGVFFYREIIPDYPGWEKPGICFALGHKLLMNYGLIRLDVFRQLGGLDEAYKFYSADIDLSFKVYKSGRQLIPLPDSSLIHNNVQDSLKGTNKTTAEKDSQYLMQKWGDYVPSTLPLPNRLFLEPLYIKAFRMPQELTDINSGLEHFWHGIACLQLDKFSEAVQQFSHTLNSSCKHWAVLWLTAKALHKAGFYAQAQQAAEFALRLNPDSTEVRLLLKTFKSGNARHKPSHATQNIKNAPVVRTGSTLVLQLRHGGLGDHLFNSHLPRIAKQAGRYDKVYISNRSKFRDEDNKRLIWQLNPYVDGFCDEPGYMFKEFETIEQGLNILDKIMLVHGLDDGKRFHEPELYFRPQYRRDLSDAVVYDPNYTSFVGDACREEIERFIQENGIGITHQMKLWEKNFPIRNFNKIIQTHSLEEFCSVVVSCRQLLCLSSGTATLAAAFGKTAIVFYGDMQKKMFHHSRLHKYVNCSAKPVLGKSLVSNIGAGIR